VCNIGSHIDVTVSHSHKLATNSGASLKTKPQQKENEKKRNTDEQ